MRERKAARSLVISPARDVLLFRFIHKNRALAGRNYRATPGGGLEDGETFHAAANVNCARRPVFRSTQLQGLWQIGGFQCSCPAAGVAVEQYFVVHAESQTLSSSKWTSQKTQVMADHHWWSAQELRSTGEKAWPEALVEMFVDAGVFEPAA